MKKTEKRTKKKKEAQKIEAEKREKRGAETEVENREKTLWGPIDPMCSNCIGGG